MQVTIDIPEPLYRELESQARESETSLEDVLLRRAGRVSDERLPAAATDSGLPLARSGEPNLILKHFTNLNDAAFMTDEEFTDLEREAIEREAAEHPEPS